MTIQEFLLRSLAAIQPVLPAVLGILLVTMIVAAVLLMQVKGLWVNQKRFRWLGVFYGLDTRGVVCLSCSWLKLMLLLALLLQFQKLDVSRYIMFLVPALIHIITASEIKRLPGKLLWLAAEVVALVSTNLVCGFYHDVQKSVMLIAVYAFMALFTALLGIYLFLMELSDISEGRSANIHE